LNPHEASNESTQETFHVFLFEQIAVGNAGTVVSLIDGGLPVDISDGSDIADTALHWACSFLNNEVATILFLHGGVDANILNGEAQTPLHVACKSLRGGAEAQNIALLNILLHEGADVARLDTHSSSAADYLSTNKSMKDGPEKEALLALLACPPLPPSFPLRTQYDENLRFRNQDESGEAAAAAAAEALFAYDLSAESCFDPESDPSAEAAPAEAVPLLVFWPPVKSQKQLTGQDPMLLLRDENLFICISSLTPETDVFALLQWSGFMDTMDTFGLVVQVKRSADNASLRLVIDSNMHSLRHSYEIQINSREIVISAGDATGLLYGIYTGFAAASKSINNQCVSDETTI
jgi:hypothetical protein